MSRGAADVCPSRACRSSASRWLTLAYCGTKPARNTTTSTMAEMTALFFISAPLFEGNSGGLRLGGASSGAVPCLHGEAGAAHFKRVVLGVEEEQFLAGFEESGLTSAFEEVLDLGADLRQVAGDGGLHAADTASI